MRSSKLGPLSYAALIAGLLAPPGLAAAADAPDAPIATNDKPPETVTVKGVTVTAPRQTPVSATFSEGTITSETVRNLSPGASTTIQTMLNQEPSIFVFSDGPLGVRTNTNFRAFNSGQFAETVDGIEINDVFNGGVTNQASNRNNVLLTTNDIDSVEVYRGINNPAVNAYDSLGGTINFISRAPADRMGGEAQVAYGSFNTVDWRATFNTGKINGLSQIFSFESASSDGWMQNTDDRNLNIYWGANYDVNADNTLSARFVYNWNDGYTPTDVPTAVLNSLGHSYMWPKAVEYERNNDTNLFGSLDWTSKLAPGVTLDNKVFGGGNDYKRVSYVNPDYLQGSQLPNPGLIPITGPFADPQYGGQMPYYIDNSSFHTSQDHHFYGYRAWAIGDTANLTLNLPHNTVIVGGNYTFAELYSREYYGSVDDMPKVLYTNDYWDEHDWRTLASIYVQDEISLFADRFHLTPGLKYVYSGTKDYDAPSYYGAAGKVSDQEFYLSPTVGASFKITSDFALFAAFGRNLKFPDISAYYDNTPNNNETGTTSQPLHIRPEYVNDYEAGFRYHGHGAYVTVDYYREDFTNTFISGSDPVTGNPTTVNGPPSTYQGVEVQLAQDFHFDRYGDAQVFFNYAHNEAQFTETQTITTTQGNILNGVVVGRVPLANIPQELISTGLTWKKDGWRFTLNGRYVGKQYLDQYNIGVVGQTENIIHPYFVMNTGLSKTVDIRALNRLNQVRFAINVDNLLNRYYFNEAFTDSDVNNNSFITAIPAAPRSVTGSITIAF